MHTNSNNRRNWLKQTALLSGGLALIPGFSAVVKAAPAPPTSETGLGYYNSEEEGFELTDPKLKARLFANENPFGPSPKAKQAIRDSIDRSYLYAIRELDSITDKLAEYEGLKPEQFLLNSGSSAILVAAALQYSKKGNIVSGNPTYEDLLKNAERMGGKVQRVSLTPEYAYDLDAMESAIDETTSLVYICNPNNPTGTIVDDAKLKAFCERVTKKTTVFVDEAYIDYAKDPKATSVVSLIKNGNPNLIVARTFSKLYGMAGLRFGYAMGNPEIIQSLSGYTSGPFNISCASLAAANASFQDEPYIKEVLEKTNISKNFLYETLKKEGYTYVPSSANFVIFPVRKDSKEFAEGMDKMGVGLRSWRFAGKDWCRISIGTLEEMKVFAAALPKMG
jgi:histidinol-phosphate aminotransferase